MYYESDSESDSSHQENAPRIAVTYDPRPCPRPRKSTTVPKNERDAPTSVEDTRTKKRTKKAIQITPVLRSPRSTNYSTATLESWFGTNMLDVDAPYQRGIVWSDVKQRDLIDSLVNNYYVPPIIFAVEQHEDHSETRVCIDGKQRLTSIHRFMIGETLPLTWDIQPFLDKDPISQKKLYYTRPAHADRKRKFLIFSDDMKKIFDTKQVYCVEYDGVTARQEREIFQASRVQLGVPLKIQEKLPSINGPYAEVARQLLSDFDDIPGLEEIYPWGNCAADFRVISQMLYVISQGCDSERLDPTNQRLANFLDQTLISTRDHNIQAIALATMKRLAGLRMSKRFSSFGLVLAHFFIYNCEKRSLGLSDRQLRDVVTAFLQDFPQDVQNFKASKQIVAKIANHISSARSKQRRESKASANNDSQSVLGKRMRIDVDGPSRATIKIKKPVFRIDPQDGRVDSRLAIRSGPRHGPLPQHRHCSTGPVAGPSKFPGSFD